MPYLSLFLSAFIAATLLPSSSELMLSAMVVKGGFSLSLLWLSATCGNVLGSCVNYALGTQVTRFADRKWFPVSAKAMARAQRQFNRFGVYSLLFAWLPVVGDPLTLIGGVFRVRFGLFLLLVSIGKGTRYLLVILMALGFEELF
ncbi:YqaA family protein [Pseudoalteromonas sp. T1lg48]|uniref:YqaA family protein n=1 Tax=Pseudoalteromonas sp. T1lg48 TaxID=2077100 RepID=UPI000CF5EE14|nr:YqaA family protein [Pseudoalteromonas sp. T1lg48]